MKAIYDELAEAGVIELSEDDLGQTAGGKSPLDWYYERKRRNPEYR